MDETQLAIMALAAFGVGVFMYVNIQKLQTKLDQPADNTPYLDFCDDILSELGKIEADERIQSLKNEIKHSAAMNANSSKDVWEDRLFAFLTKLDAAIGEKFGTERADEIRSSLQDKFKRKFS